MLTKQDKINISITFIAGLISGVYVYASGYSFRMPDKVSQEYYGEFRVVGKSYMGSGNCKVKGCLSFEVKVDGSYSLITYEVDGEQVRKLGNLDSSLKKELSRELKPADLKTQAEKSAAKSCASDSGNGKMDFNFRVTIDGKEYELDSCKTKIDPRTKSWQTLAKLWDTLGAI